MNVVVRCMGIGFALVGFAGQTEVAVAGARQSSSSDASADVEIVQQAQSSSMISGKKLSPKEEALCKGEYDVNNARCRRLPNKTPRDKKVREACWSKSNKDYADCLSGR